MELSFIIVSGMELCGIIYLLVVCFRQSEVIDGYMEMVAELATQVDEVFKKVIQYEKKYGKIE